MIRCGCSSCCSKFRVDGDPLLEVMIAGGCCSFVELTFFWHKKNTPHRTETLSVSLFAPTRLDHVFPLHFGAVLVHDALPHCTEIPIVDDNTNGYWGIQVLRSYWITPRHDSCESLLMVMMFCSMEFVQFWIHTVHDSTEDPVRNENFDRFSEPHFRDRFFFWLERDRLNHARPITGWRYKFVLKMLDGSKFAL